MSAQGRPREYDERVSTGLRLPVSLHNRLRAEASGRGVSANLLVERAIEEYLDRLVPVEEALRTQGRGPA